jgi:flagellar hook protein FlgE
MMRSLFSGVSGIRAHQVRMDVIGNNIANINTIGFKGSRATFSDVLSQTLSGATGPSSTRGGTNPIQVGLGVGTSAIDTLFSQGNLESTGQVTDLALTGDGFFVLRDGVQRSYTRAGAFQFDSDGTLVNPSNGFIVQGYLADSSGNISPGTGVKDITLPFAQSVAAKATDWVTYRGNLNADSDPLGTIEQSVSMYEAGARADAATLLTDLENGEGVTSGVVATDVITVKADIGGVSVTPVTLTVGAATTLGALADSIETALGLSAGSVSVNSSGQLVIRGAKGEANEITNVSITARDTGGTLDRLVFNTLNIYTPIQAARDAGSHTATIQVYDSLGATHTLSLDFTKVDGANEWTWQASLDGTASVVSGGSGRVFFRQDGSFDSFTYDAGATALSIFPGNQAQSPLQLQLDFGNTGEFGGLTQFVSSFTAVASNQTGYSNGTLDSISIDQTGKITGRFTNGVLKTMAQIALANFTNPAGLSRDGENNFVVSLNSGDALIGIPGSGVQGTIVSGALEQSNVDLALQFTDMIIAQRGYQAAARVIRNADEMLNEVVNIRR